MAIESDRAEFIAACAAARRPARRSRLLIPNKDWKNWQLTMHVEAEAPEGATGARRAPVVRPRPGHADLVGRSEVRARRSARRARARERARNGGARRAGCDRAAIAARHRHRGRQPRHRHRRRRDARRILRSRSTRARDIPADSPLHCADTAIEADDDRRDRSGARGRRHAGRQLRSHRARRARRVLDRYVQWDRKLDGRLAQALMSIPAIKACRHRSRHGSRPAAWLARARRNRRRTRAPTIDDPAIARPDQSRRRSRRWRHQRRRDSRVGVHEADLDADEAAAIGRS